MRRFFALLAILGLALLTGCASLNTMRREFIALRYMQEAESRLRTFPRDTSRAIEELDRAVALMPDDAELSRRAARLYTAARAWEKAIPHFEAQDDLQDQDRLAYARCLLNTDREDEGGAICLKIIERVMQRRKQAGATRPEWALLLNDAGYILVDANMHLDTGWEAISAATKAVPLQAAFVDSVGWAHYRRGELKDAAFHLERARRHATEDDPEMLYHLGVVYGRLGRYGDATRVLQKAHRLAPEWDVIQKELTRVGRILPPPVRAAHTAGPESRIDRHLCQRRTGDDPR